MPEWLLPILVGVVLVGLAAYIWHAHDEHDRERFDKLWDQIGRDSDHGMRKTVHKSANVLDALSKEIPDLERRLDRLERKVDER